MNYSRLGLYVPRKINKKKKIEPDDKHWDWMNIFLFIALAVVILLFVFGK